MLAGFGEGQWEQMNFIKTDDRARHDSVSVLGMHGGAPIFIEHSHTQHTVPGVWKTTRKEKNKPCLKEPAG